jgi:hypothetical protein
MNFLILRMKSSMNTISKEMFKIMISMCIAYFGRWSGGGIS